MNRSQRGGIFLRLLFLLGFFLLLFGIYLVRHPLMAAAGRFWIVEDPAAQADAIVVLGDDDFSGSRAFRAAELYRAGRAPQVVASGRKLRSYSGIAELIARDVATFGVPANAIVRFDHDAANTRDEAIALRGLAAEKRWGKILVVTSNYHTRRARLIFSKIFPAQVSVAVIPAHDAAFNPDSWWTTRAGRKIFFLESVGYPVARWELRQ